MADEKVMNRWIVVVGAILIQLCPRRDLRVERVHQENQPIRPAGTDSPRGRRPGSSPPGSPRLPSRCSSPDDGRRRSDLVRFAMIGGVILGIGYILGGILGETFNAQLVCIGIIGGAGIGLAYVVPIAVGVKWFPDKKGMITGLAVAGFGFGATIWVKLAGSWFGGLLNTTSVFGLPGVQSVFLIYGVVFLVLVLLGSLVMVNPPAGWKPAGWNPEAPSGGKSTSPSGAVDLTVGQMVGTPQYWGLMIMFIGSALAGLMVIYCIRLFGVDSLQANNVASDATAAGMIAGTAMAWYAILNGLGRIIWGTLSDKIGRKAALFLMCMIQGVMMLVFFKVRREQDRTDHRRVRDWVQLRRQLCPVPRRHRRPVRQQERGLELPVGLHRVRNRRDRRTADCGLLQRHRRR